MNKAERLALVKSVLNAMSIHQIMAIRPTKQTIKMFEKVERGFL